MDPVSILPPEIGVETLTNKTALSKLLSSKIVKPSNTIFAVWELIVNKLPTHKEKLSAYNTCSLWRSFLVKNRTMWMFQGIFCSLFKYLPGSDILKLRLICKSWNGVIESYLENSQSFIHSPGRHHDNTGRVVPFRTMEVDFDISGSRLGMTPKQTLKRFEEEFTSDDADAQCSKNPIVSRSVCLTLLEVDFEVLKFFETFGVHLWYLKLYISQQPPYKVSTSEQTVKFIWRILALVPNVQKLVLTTTIQNSIEETEDAKKKQVQDLEHFLQNNLAPSLPRLNDLQIQADFVHLNLMCTSLETLYCSQLTKYVHTAYRQFCAPTNLTNLTEVAWVFVDGCTLSKLEKLKNLDSPRLQRLFIYVIKYGARIDNDPPRSCLFEVIENFEKSLTHLSLYWRYLDGTFPEVLDLPLLQEFSLEIRNCENPKNINLFFLQKLRSLRKLTCVLWEDCYWQLFDVNEHFEREAYGQTAEKIDFHWHFNEDLNGGPYKSNIWRLMPSLHIIKVQLVKGLFPLRKTVTKVYARAQMN